MKKHRVNPNSSNEEYYLPLQQALDSLLAAHRGVHSAGIVSAEASQTAHLLEITALHTLAVTARDLYTLMATQYYKDYPTAPPAPRPPEGALTAMAMRKAA